MARYTKAQTENARNTLREMLKPGDRVHTILRHVSRSGMMRHISVVVQVPADKKAGTPAEVRDITWLVAQATNTATAEGFGREGLKVGGVGMDMGFHVVYGLSHALYPNGHKCTGSNGYVRNNRDGDYRRSTVPACPSNDHSNEREANYTRTRTHSSGGYALRQAWL